MPDDKPERSDWFRYVALGQVGLEMAAPIVVGVFLDRWLGWEPWLTIVGALMGLVGGMAHLIAILNSHQ